RIALGRLRNHWSSAPSVAKSCPSEVKRPTSIGERTSGRSVAAGVGGAGVTAVGGSVVIGVGAGAAAATFSVDSAAGLAEGCSGDGDVATRGVEAASFVTGSVEGDSL